MAPEPAPPRAHSPEPWTSDRKDPRMVMDAQGRLVGVLTTPEDARRILAAVNATRGLPDAGLDAAPVLAGLQSLFDICRYHSDPKFRESADKDGGLEKLLASANAGWQPFGRESFRE
ncbi:MAG: hypothetical protein LC796_01290 [Acidobacteria bacterium]|nr:hypothetical protein [Acidobacteriota bacterium]MCA1610183.1 hypothetical protein [Acidobacteriota bacterium]